MSGPLQAAWVRGQAQLEQRLPVYLLSQRWFGGKTRIIQGVKILDVVPVPMEAATAAILLAQISYERGPAETYVIPLLEPQAAETSAMRPPAAAGEQPTLAIELPSGEQLVLSDALWDRDFLSKLLEALRTSVHFAGSRGEIVARPLQALETLRRSAHGPLEPSLLKAEQSNTSVLYGHCFILKFFRRVEEGINPDVEIGEFLSARAGFPHVPPLAGLIEYRGPGAVPVTVGILQGYVANQGDVWKRTLSLLDNFYIRAAGTSRLASPGPWGNSLVAGSLHPSEVAGLWLGEYRLSAHRLGRRTGELHLALCSDPNDPDFSPEPFSLDYQRELSRSMIELAEEAFGLLRGKLADLRDAPRQKARAALAAEEEILRRFRLLAQRPLSGLRIRIHGDLHLGQVLDTGDDFVFIDFEGEPARSLTERRAKHSPLRDVAGMLRSFHYAANVAMFDHVDRAAPAPQADSVVGFASSWAWWACVEFLRGYFEAADQAAFLPGEVNEREFALNLWMLDKAMYELKYELNHRLDWVRIPLESICDLVQNRPEERLGSRLT